MSAPFSSQPAPIADLSYRNYDGPLEPPQYRWWAIAKMTMKMAFKKKMMWVFMALSGWYYIGMIFVLFVVTQLGENTPVGARGLNPTQQFLDRIVWKDQFIHGFSFAQMLYLLIALIVGAGAIANDNRANALLVYLSKPCTKLDYLFGKWVGIFVPLLMAMAIPSLLFYIYAALSYADQGFISDDPWLIVKLLILFPISAGFYASLVLGFSSMFNQGRIAGATLAGLYFLSNFFTQMMTIAWVSMAGRRSGRGPEAAIEAVKMLYYWSVDGINIGTAKAVLGTDSSAYFGIPSRLRMVPMPPLALHLGVMIGLSALAMFIAWRRIRAVEVVGS